VDNSGNCLKKYFAEFNITPGLSIDLYNVCTVVEEASANRNESLLFIIAICRLMLYIYMYVCMYIYDIYVKVQIFDIIINLR
jgi:hypothetical protein